MPLFTLDDLNDAAAIVGALVPRTPAYAWPLLREALGVEVVVKHENHTPTGSFKARGGPVYVEAVRRARPDLRGLVTATRGNHGQSVALAATRAGLPAIVVVPDGNAEEKNAAMRAFGAELVVAGRDFDESRVTAAAIERERGFLYVPSFHRDLVRGVATYAAELFADHPDLHTVYAPIGMGSGLAGLITLRDLLGLKTEIVGVVAEAAPAFALSVQAGRIITTETARTFADGMACREPQPDAFEIIRQGAARIVTVSEDEIAEAIRLYHRATHNLAEGAGAAALAALAQERHRLAGSRAGVILCGGNIDLAVLRRVLSGETPAA